MKESDLWTGRKMGTDRSVHAAPNGRVLSRGLADALGQRGLSPFFAHLFFKGSKIAVGINFESNFICVS